MRSRLDLTIHLLESASDTLLRNVEAVSLEEAIFVPVGGYRSILGTLKHAAGWSHVYRSYAFDPQPRHWGEVDWPGGLRDTIIADELYFKELIDWFKAGHQLWLADLGKIRPVQIDELRPCHWGERMPLFDIVNIIAHHHVYHAGEMNQLLSIRRGEAWEEGEQVEENLTSTIGHRVRPPWMDNPQKPRRL
jgi:hypothetical protein